MKTLYLIRHAKSSWEFDISDDERPLNTRGLNDAELIGEELKSLIKPIDKVLCSPAKRTRMTASIILKHLEIPETKFSIVPDLYDFSGNQVMDEIKKCDAAIDTLMVFGHNHGFTSIVNFLGNKRIDNLPTSGVVAIEFDVKEWQDISVGNTLLTLFPKSLR
ncbi:histidine phosphatase family protein [Aquimarina sp. I32.4]|uniref:SixA phosphatase family protein n=1 Tax=Aquimarina sp. I32.4 TaxID=2053903 RepID=UPI000CDE608D|nr:histidine phosphatase family protein [Aquimarina sp. I32.4]